jgi:hypothetical protein
MLPLPLPPCRRQASADVVLARCRHRQRRAVALPPPPLTLPLLPRRRQAAADVALSRCLHRRSLRAALARERPNFYDREKCGSAKNCDPLRRRGVVQAPFSRFFRLFFFLSRQERVNQFEEQFLNLFHMPGGPTLDTDGTVNFVTNQHNDEQQSPLLSSIIPQSLIPPPLAHLATLPRTYAIPRPASPPKSLTRA